MSTQTLKNRGNTGLDALRIVSTISLIGLN